MKIEVLPADIKVVHLTKSGTSGYISYRITLPKDIIKRHRLQVGQSIIIAYVCKSKEDIKL